MTGRITLFFDLCPQPTLGTRYLLPKLVHRSATGERQPRLDGRSYRPPIPSVFRPVGFLYRKLRRSNGLHLRAILPHARISRRGSPYRKSLACSAISRPRGIQIERYQAPTSRSTGYWAEPRSGTQKRQACRCVINLGLSSTPLTTCSTQKSMRCRGKQRLCWFECGASVIARDAARPIPRVWHEKPSAVRSMSCNANSIANRSLSYRTENSTAGACKKRSSAQKQREKTRMSGGNKESQNQSQSHSQSVAMQMALRTAVLNTLHLRMYAPTARRVETLSIRSNGSTTTKPTAGMWAATR